MTATELSGVRAVLEDLAVVRNRVGLPADLTLRQAEAAGLITQVDYYRAIGWECIAAREVGA